MRPFTSLLSRWTNSPATDRSRTGRPGSSGTRVASNRRRPSLEALEGRALLSNIYVNLLADTPNVAPGQVTLRMAIGMANNNPGADTIYLPAGNFTLSSGELHVTNGPLTIEPNANDGKARTIDAQGASRVFEVDAEVSVDFESLGIQGGFASSGRRLILNNGAVTLNNCQVTNNTTIAGFQRTVVYLNGAGAGIFNNGNVTLNNCHVNNNTTSGDGGGILNDGILSATNLYLFNNQAYDGGGLWTDIKSANACLATVQGSNIQNNFATDCGGGVWGGGSTFLSNDQIQFNTAGLEGGGLLAAGSVYLGYSNIDGNHAQFGGGVANTATMTIVETGFAYNGATFYGGGLYESGPNLFGPTPTLHLSSSTFYYNTAGMSGGGVYSWLSNFDYSSLTFGGNSKKQFDTDVVPLDGGSQGNPVGPD